MCVSHLHIRPCWKPPSALQVLVNNAPAGPVVDVETCLVFAVRRLCAAAVRLKVTRDRRWPAGCQSTLAAGVADRMRKKGQHSVCHSVVVKDTCWKGLLFLWRCSRPEDAVRSSLWTLSAVSSVLGTFLLGERSEKHLEPASSMWFLTLAVIPAFQGSNLHQETVGGFSNVLLHSNQWAACGRSYRSKQIDY